MTSPRPASPTPPDNPTEKPKGAGLSVVQIAAGALAAVSSAVLLSFFGVAGTLIGAALASVLSTVGAALYGTSLNKTNERLRKVLTGRQTEAVQVTADATRQMPATTTLTVSPVPAGSPALPAHLDPRRPPAQRARRPRWGRIAVYAVAVFVLAMGIVTGIELIGQKPVSALVTHSSSSGTTTLGELTNSSSTRNTTPSSPTPTAPATSTADNSPAEPSATGGTDSGSATATPSRTPGGSSSASSPATTTGAPGEWSAPMQGAETTP